jgi:FAD/FMN-containing dehydrogenase
MNSFITLCQQSIGEEHVLLDEFDLQPYLTEWRKRATGKAIAIVLPATTEEVSALVKLCVQFNINIVPQGGNTGLVIGSIPTRTSDVIDTIVLSLRRLNRIRSVDATNNTMIVEAGCQLHTVQDAATQHERLFPLSLASEGSCTIGGNLSTNAGGTAVLRYGNMRDLCLGLEVVTADGEIWNGLRGLRKDNTGYDLRDLYIGAEGTLGIITAAVLKLFPKPTAQFTALCAVNNIEDAVSLLHFTQNQCANKLTAFELISKFALSLVQKHFPHLSNTIPTKSPYYVLLEISEYKSESEIERMNQLEMVCEKAFENHLIQDAIIATSNEQAKTLWQLRESISEAQAKEGKNIKHDISLPISSIANFVQQTDALLQQAYPTCRLVTFGHVGDGNLHYNVSPPIGEDAQEFLAQQNQINRIVYDSVNQFNGSISAEHGIGTLKKEELVLYKSATELNLMRAIKLALDPHNIMNPGKII